MTAPALETNNLTIRPGLKKAGWSEPKGVGSGHAANKASQNERALVRLEELCLALGPGARLPLHKELMQSFEVSERAILRAFDDLQRTGKIVRKPRAGTFVADSVSVDELVAAPADVRQPDRSAASVRFLGTTLPRAIIAIAHADHSFYERCLDLLCAYADDNEFSVFCKPVRVGDEPSLKDLGALVTDPALCRFVLFSYRLEPLARQLHERGAHVVLVGTPPTGMTPPVPCVHGNQEFGGYLITRHLIDAGHRRISFVHDSDNLLETPRWQGHQRALREARKRGAKIEDSILRQAIDEWADDASRASDYLRQPNAPTALIAWNDGEAAKLLSVLLRAGVRVPDEVSVTGYDDLPSSRTVYPALTTVDPAINYQLLAAMDILSAAQKAGSILAPVATVVMPTLIVRESVAAPSARPSSTALAAPQRSAELRASSPSPATFSGRSQ